MISPKERRALAQALSAVQDDTTDGEAAASFYHGKPQTEQRVKRAVDQPQQQLPEQRVRYDALAGSRNEFWEADVEHGNARRQRASCDSLLPIRERAPPGAEEPGRTASGVARLALFSRPPKREPRPQPLTSGHLPSFSGRKASAAGMVARSFR